MLFRSRKQWTQWLIIFFWAPKLLQMVTAAMKLKDAYSLEGKLCDFVGGVDALVKRRKDVGLSCHIDSVAAFAQQVGKTEGDLQIDVLLLHDAALAARILSAVAWIDDDFADDMARNGSRTEDWIDDLLEVDEAEEAPGKSGFYARG